MNSVHRSHDRELFMAGKRHFVWVFHDSTFECVADGFDVEVERGSLTAAITGMARMLTDWPA